MPACIDERRPLIRSNSQLTYLEQLTYLKQLYNMSRRGEGGVSEGEREVSRGERNVHWGGGGRQEKRGGGVSFHEWRGRCRFFSRIVTAIALPIQGFETKTNFSKVSVCVEYLIGLLR